MILRGRALEILVKQHAEMSLFLKHVADKQQFPVFSNAAVDITMPSPWTQSRPRHFRGIPEEQKIARTT